MILGAQDVTLHRYGIGSRGTDGRFTRGAATVSTIQATVQPMNGKELSTLPEGDRTRRGIKLYTTTQLLTADQDAKRLSDRIIYQTETFEVRHVDQQPRVIPHYRAYAVRLDEATT
uniref:Head-tail joining protein n=1 Tax=viral metagenome TaxID=1070528 RepID=A0A6M3M0V9_9ZZZZ